MNAKTKRLVYIGVKSLLTIMVLATISNSAFNPEFNHRFNEIGYPTYLIVPLMIAKGLGLIVIWFDISKPLREWAYAGFTFLFLLAFLAEVNAPVPDFMSPVLALILLLISYILWGNRKKKSDLINS